jgi:hypothetical protein
MAAGAYKVKLSSDSMIEPGDKLKFNPEGKEYTIDEVYDEHVVLKYALEENVGENVDILIKRENAYPTHKEDVLEGIIQSANGIMKEVVKGNYKYVHYKNWTRTQRENMTKFFSDMLMLAVMTQMATWIFFNDDDKHTEFAKTHLGQTLENVLLGTSQELNVFMTFNQMQKSVLPGIVTMTTGTINLVQALQAVITGNFEDAQNFGYRTAKTFGAFKTAYEPAAYIMSKK